MSKIVNSTAGLLAALKAAKGGDTILLAPGTYDSVALSNFKFNSAVTIASSDPTHQAVLSNLSLSNDAYITFKQLNITTSAGTAATVQGSNHITFAQDAFSGGASGTGNAMMLRGSDSITITGSDFGKFGTGINLLTDSKVAITNNVFHDISSGDIRGSAVTASTITGNTFLNADGTIASHGDVISLWQDNAANQVVIDANIFGSTAKPVPPATPTAPVDAAVIGGYVNAAHDTVGQTIGGVAGAGVSVTVYDNGTKVGTAAANSSGAWTYQVGALADGSSHSYTVTATDQAGNTSAASAALNFKVDASAPTTPAAPADAAVSNGYVNAARDTAGQAIGGMTEAGASVAVYDNGAQVATVTANSSGAWSYQVGALADGSAHSYTVKATDQAGNTSAASAALTFKVDASAPAQPGAPVDAAVSNGYVNAAHDTAGQAIGGMTEAGASVAVYDNGAQVATVAANSSGAWSYQVGALADGSAHSYTVTATDQAGNTSAASAALNFKVDASAPTTPAAPADAAVSNGYVDAAHNTAAQTIGGMSEAGASVAVYDNGAQVATVAANNAGAWTYQVGALTAGSSHSYTITATDLAGNTSAASAALNFTVGAPPPPPAAVTEVSSVQQLMTALAAAHAGDVIALDAGTYDGVGLTGFNFSSAVTIMSTDQTHQAVLSNLGLASSSGLTFDHVGLTTSNGTAVSLQDSHGLTFSNDAFSSNGSNNAMMLRNSDSISITGSDIGHFGTGINVSTDSNITITNDVFHDITASGIRGTGLTSSTISGNTFSDTGSAPYLWQDNTANHVTIANNVYAAGSPVTSPPPASSSSSSSSSVSAPPASDSAPPVVTAPSAGGGQTVTVNNTAQLVAAVWAAHVGDTIKLAAGTYDYTALDGLKFTGGVVTVTSADTSHQAVINGMEVAASSNLNFDHLIINPGTANGINVLGDTNVSFSNLTIGGMMGTMDGLGMFVRDSTNVSVSNSEFSWTGSGLAHLTQTTSPSRTILSTT